MTTRRKCWLLILTGGAAFVIFGFAGYGYLAVAGWMVAAGATLWFAYDFVKEQWRRPK